jgi:hypothetical protein
MREECQENMIQDLGMIYINQGDDKGEMSTKMYI